MQVVKGMTAMPRPRYAVTVMQVHKGMTAMLPMSKRKIQPKNTSAEGMHLFKLILIGACMNS
jgi:hypothetical protein